MNNSKAYPKYKDSGVEWLSEIPDGWTIKPIRQLFKIGRGRVIAQTELVENALYPVYSSQTKNSGILGYINEYDFDCNQITWTTDGANAGTVFIRSGKHNCTNVCGTLQTRRGQNLSLPFCKYSLENSTPHYKRPDTNGAKIMNGEMAAIPIVFPSIPEQISIASFLDDKVGKIDKAIAQKELLIKQLNERKQIVIQHAVTKGLNPDAPMKDSGIDWIGQIPDHWEVKRLKYLFKERNHRTETGKETLLSLRMKIGLVPHDEVSDKPILDDQLIGYKIAKHGQIVMNRMRASIGIFGLVNTPGLVSPDYAVFDSTDAVDEEFFLLLFKTTKVCEQFRINSKGLGTGESGFMRLYSDSFGRIRIALPKTSEQQKIVTYIREQSLKIDQVNTQEQQAIAKLKEYNATLINSAVTGKINVSEYGI